MTVEQINLAFENLKQKKISLALVDDVDSLLSKALSKQLEASSMASKTSMLFQDANDFYAQADSLISKGISSAKELGADSILKELASKTKTSSNNYTRNTKAINTLKSI
jgi:reverse gyrase